MPFRIAFRVDSGTIVGSGHVMRCLTLADALRGEGAECHFLTKPHDGHLAELIHARKHVVHLLPRPDGKSYGAHAAPPSHAEWLGTSWKADAVASREILSLVEPDWLVLDHYALDRAWEEAALPDNVPLAVIDDLADRPHDASFLLDQTLGREREDYSELIPPNCFCLFGPQNALLRPEFANLRPAALSRRDGRIRSLLITLGGVDKDDITGKVLTALRAIDDLPDPLTVTVVMGSRAPWLDRVYDLAKRMQRPTSVLTDISDMARTMVENDLCIGAAGSTTWERCALGLPTLMIVLAENQLANSRALTAAGGCKEIRFTDVTSLSKAIAEALKNLDSTAYCTMAACAAAICDGSGTFKTVRHLQAKNITLRPATLDDAIAIWRWRHEDDAWRHYRRVEATPLDHHLDWFQTALSKETHRLLIASYNGRDIGHLRFDWQRPGEPDAEISLCLAGDSRGKGLGTRIIAAGVLDAAVHRIRRLRAEVSSANTTSLRAFLKCGFREVERTEGFVKLVLDMKVK